VAALGLVLFIACGEQAGTTTSASPATTATTGAPSTSEAVAVAFFQAWQAGDRQAMERLSEPDALAAAEHLADLVSETWEPELCEGAAGTVHCIWISDAGTLAIGVRNIEEPHLVTSFGLLEP
jgi:hypothetical protein